MRTVSMPAGAIRITTVGAFLHKTSLDELPQLLNVPKGKMSVVGHCPHMLRHTKDCAQVVKHFMDRHLVKPGINGAGPNLGLPGRNQGSAAHGTAGQGGSALPAPLGVYAGYKDCAANRPTIL
jgi:hypothetical protein